MILGPVMLELGMHPLVVASTSLLLVGASSSSATVGFALADRLNHGWGIIMFLVCTVASVVGVAIIGRMVRRSGKSSVIVFLLVALMGLGGLMTAVSTPSKCCRRQHCTLAAAVLVFLAILEAGGLETQP